MHELNAILNVVSYCNLPNLSWIPSKTLKLGIAVGSLKLKPISIVS